MTQETSDKADAAIYHLGYCSAEIHLQDFKNRFGDEAWEWLHSQGFVYQLKRGSQTKVRLTGAGSRLASAMYS